jgi:hypothetical protein
MRVTDEDPRTVALTLMMARAIHASNVPFIAMMTRTPVPQNGKEVTALWESLDQDTRNGYIDMAAGFIIMLKDEGLLAAETEWGVEFKKDLTQGWDHARLERQDDRETAVEYFREMELERPFEEYARLVSRGVTHWKQVLDDGT